MLEAQDTENKRRIAELDRKLQNSKAAVKEKNQGSIKSQLTEKKDSLEEKSAIFLENFPEIAPLISHPSLVALAIEKLKPASQGRSQLVDELRSILERLPVRLFDEPQFPKPSLTDAQQRFLKQKAELLIEAELDLASSGNDENAWSINVDRARRVEGQLAMFVATSGLRESFAFQLREITKLVRDEVILKAELEDLSSLPKADREKQEERRLERAALEESSNITREKIGMLRAQMISTSRNIEKLRGEVNFQERKVSDATRNQISVEIAEKTLAGIRLYKGALKQARQSEIQTAMNTHFKSLLDSHGLIDSIVFDEDFRMNYLDASGVRAD
jgi:DNA sulfur modification protein DndD